ncbi:6-phospho-3-hexuloisomerase [Myceligenerans indicum]|uniref:6-phospho-3-hexuloisomerase n=1 Tax=Myceligenerans indicum TaxID=2593663 RepID=A0ABS1LIA1_9MICO|nr:6-phospho-3-hexuloisomerase [Myceligenerans indicum]MBL0885956.1 6-phospho-3-hexuloisomerase [Myceligenerans indicum]
MNATRTGVADALGIVADENVELIQRLRALGDAPMDGLASRMESARRVFVHGAGRSGLALRMVAMRLMHLGLKVHVVGEVTAPAIGRGDLLLVASGSGRTPGVVRAAETATDVGAQVAALTTAADSPLARLSSVVVLPAAHKTDRTATASVQYAGSLFEQGVLLVGDALFHLLWQRGGQTADGLWHRHANLE